MSIYINNVFKLYYTFSKATSTNLLEMIKRYIITRFKKLLQVTKNLHSVQVVCAKTLYGEGRHRNNSAPIVKVKGMRVE